MDKIGRLALLFDFYGQLLTAKQQEIIGLYYEQNLSLGEIAEELGVSRQAVHDIIRRGEKVLESYEQKLGLVAKFLNERSKLNEASELLKKYKSTNNPDTLDQLSAVIKEVLELNTIE
ncbi:MAG: YlxM family DNA-binding protein [Bacillota bacterium]